MLECRSLFEVLQRSGVGSFTELPDSPLGDLCAFFPDRRVVAANEGAGSIEMRCRRGARSDPGQPRTTTAGNKEAFVRGLRS